MTPFISEIVGTALLLLLGGGVVANVLLNKTFGNNSGWLVITIGWALAVYVAVVVSGPYSGAHINPAVSIGLSIAGKFSWKSLPSYIVAQMIGSMLGSFFVWFFYKKHFEATENAENKKAVFCTAPAIRDKFYNLMSEIIGTFILVFTILNFTQATILDTKEIIGLGSLGAIPVSLLVLAIGISLGGTTGYAINPARDLGPRIIYSILPIKNKVSSDWSYSWIPVIGPILGSSIASIVSVSIKY